MFYLSSTFSSFLATLADSIDTHCEGKKTEFHEEELKNNFPHFLWLSRDNNLMNKDISGNKISPTQHLMTEILIRSNESSPTTEDLVVNALRTLYPSIECLQIPTPIASPEGGIDLSNVGNKAFAAGICETVGYILKSIQPKKGRNGHYIKGDMLASLTSEYIKAINEPNAVPNVELSWMTAVELQLRKLSSTFIADYEESMDRCLKDKLPIEEGKFTKANLMPSESILLATQAKQCTLQDIHQRSFSMLCHCFRGKITHYMPNMGLKDSTNAISQKYKQILDEYQDQIVVFAVKGTRVTVTGGALKIFLDKNYTASKYKCERLFDELYSEQISVHGKIDLMHLQHAYNQKARERGLGPAVSNVREHKMLEIPGVPKKLRAEEISSSSLLLSWCKPEKNSHIVEIYKISVFKQDGKEWNNVKTLSSSTEKIMVENLIPNTKYSFKVCGFNHLKRGECSDRCEFKMSPGKPNKPQKPQVDLLSPTQARISVPALSEVDENGSRVNRMNVLLQTTDSNHKHFGTQYKAISKGVSVYECTIDIPDTVNCDQCSSVIAKVQVFNNIGESEFSETNTIPISHLIPGPPKDMTVTSGTREVTLSWKKACPHPAAASFYCIEFREMQGSWETRHTSFAETELKYTFHKLTPASTYLVRVSSGNKVFSIPKEYSKAEVEVSTEPDRPSCPPVPYIQIDPNLGCRQAHLIVSRLSKEEENGNAVHSLLVMQRLNNEGQWKEDECKINQDASDIRVVVDLFNGELDVKVIHFHIMMINDIGRSDKSGAYALEPKSMIPGPPQDLSCSEVTYSSAKVMWKKPKENPISVDHYFVEMRSNSSDWKTVANVDSRQLFLVLNDLLPNTSYEFRANTVNKDNLMHPSQCSNVISINTQPCKPIKPDHNEISLDVVNNATAELEIPKPRYSDSGSKAHSLEVTLYNEKKLKVCQPQILAICDTDLESESKYMSKKIHINSDTHFIQVAIVNEIGASEPSEFIGVAPSSLIPGIPGKFSVIENEIQSRQIVLSWEPPMVHERAAKKYTLEMKVNHTDGVNDPRWTDVVYKLETKDDKHFAVVSDLKPCTMYCFQVRANNDKVSGDFTDELRVSTIGAPPHNPPKPHILQSKTNPLNALVTIQKLDKDKQNGDPETNVVVELSDESNKWRPIHDYHIKKHDASVDHYRFEIKLTNITETSTRIHYLFRIKMKNKFGESGPSEEVSMPLSSLQPGKVQELKVSCNAAHSATLEWKRPAVHPAIVSNYCITRSLDNNEWSNELTLDSNSNDQILRAVISKLPMDATIYFRVVPKNREVDGFASKIDVKTPEIFPGPPTRLRQDKVQPTKVKIRWHPPNEHPEAVDSYKVEVFHKDENVDEHRGIGRQRTPDTLIGEPKYTKKCSKVLSGLQTFTKYDVRVTAQNANGNITKSEKKYEEIEVKTVLEDRWRRLINGLTIGQGARRPDPDNDLVSSGDENT